MQQISIARWTLKFSVVWCSSQQAWYVANDSSSPLSLLPHEGKDRERGETEQSGDQSCTKHGILESKR